MRYWNEIDKGYGYVDDTMPELAIAIFPEYRRQGIGTQLLATILEQAKESCSAVSLSYAASLSVRIDNPVIKLYEQFRFIPLKYSALTNRVRGTSITITHQCKTP